MTEIMHHAYGFTVGGALRYRADHVAQHGEREGTGSRSRTLAAPDQATRHSSTPTEMTARHSFCNKSVADAHQAMKNSQQINCYVINLPRDRERRERMEALLGGLQIDFSILNAVIGSELTAEHLNFFEHRAEMKLLPAEFGCLLSHLECWRTFIASEADLAFVCEDDIHVSPDIKDCLSGLQFPDEAPAIVRLEGFGCFTTFAVRPAQRIGRYAIHRMFTDHGGTAGYVINKRTARHLLDAAPRFRNAIDIEMFFPARSTVGGISVYQFIPALVVQDQILTHNQSVGFLKSNMGDQRADRNIWNKRSFGQRLKCRSRPYYQALYSAMLRIFAGKMRLIVPFR